jgi:predicted amidophosphoribosyltransferase
MFYDFKTGQKRLAYPLALGMFKALVTAGATDIDAIVPIPLSPEKAKRGEFNRTLGLAKQLALMLNVRVSDCLSLKHPISKHHLKVELGYTPAQFETAYAAELLVTNAPVGRRVLLLDDACTEGSTLRVSGTELKAAGVTRVVAATACQMAVRATVSDAEPLLVAAPVGN